MIKCYEELEERLKEYAMNFATLHKKEAEMNERLNRIKEDFDEKTKDLRYAIDTLSTEISMFCTKNKKDFEKSRSKEYNFGVIGFRTTPPKVAVLNRKYSIKTVIELTKRLFQNTYIRIKEELDKEAILADYSQKKLDDEKLASIGLKVDQEEQFYINPKFEEFV